jgi:ubiquinone/menaquinone biosynthesis C-methylase UbiE
MAQVKSQETARKDTKELRRILFAGFDQDRTALLRTAFSGRFTVHAATDGTEALRILRDLQSVHALVVQQDMAPMTGSDFLRVAHELFGGMEQTVKMLVSGTNGHTGFEGASVPGAADAYCTGEFDAPGILAKINRLFARRSREKRSSLRVDVSGNGAIGVEIGIEGQAKLEDIGEDGMFLRTGLSCPVGKVLPLVLHLPNGADHLVLGHVTRVDGDRKGFGVRFQSVGKGAREAIFDLLRDHSSLRDFDDLKERYPFLKTDDMIAFQSPDRIESFLKIALRSGVEIIAIRPQTRVSTTLHLADMKPGLTCALTGKDLNIIFKTSDSVFVSFQAGYATYNFETKIRRIKSDGSSMECFFPRIMFYSEKRSVKRKYSDGSLRLEIHIPRPFQKRIDGRITDISDGGASFIAESDGIALLAGTPLESIKIFEGDKLVRDEMGEIRNVVGLDGPDSGKIRYGVQFGIGRLNIQATRAPEARLVSRPAEPAGKPQVKPGMRRAADLHESVHGTPDVIRFENAAGEEIVGLLNTSVPLDDQPVPVVIIPPAFGKTKETLFGLALTLVENFRLLGKPLAVIRYDGVRRKGESHKDPEASEPPYEMVNASVSQGRDDIKAVLDWLDVNPRKLKAGQVILVSFSLSALEARLALRDEACRRRISTWIACMGTLEFRDLMSRVNCGLDLLEQHQLGIDLGVIPILGNLIRMEHYAGDVVANGVATLDQARDDMRGIDIPVTWIYGEHDHWVNAEFVRDVMSIQADAPRDVIPVPIGHNARTSEEALRLFGTISALIHRFLYGEMINPLIPDKMDMEIMRRAEQDRLPSRNLKNRKDYWERYLVGKNDLLGFDVMALSDDYQKLMEDQLVALDLKPEDHLLDLGGGTGNFINHLIDRGLPLPARTTIADLIPEGMKQARRKILSRIPAMNGHPSLDILCLDLELNRFLPVRRYLKGEIGRFRDLAERIENLSLESAVKVDEAFSPRLHRVLRGEQVTPELDRWLRSRFDLTEYRIVVDFNLAARYVRGLAAEKPAFRKMAFPGGLETAFHLPIKPGIYNKVLMSLVLSYIFDPVETLREIHRIIRPGGILILSSMRPDTDSSGPFTRLMAKLETMSPDQMPAQWPKTRLLDSIRSFLNDAQALVDLEEAGTFDFFDPGKLDDLLEEAGWERTAMIPTFGDPPQGYVVAARVRNVHA